ncbi:hypothetical protein MKW92_052757 [Papaver armeniacum]|nr:hypothetical protein MKW92_052757 [Papaver armeniacum]
MDQKGEQVYVGSIDQGTTSTRFIIYDKSAKTIASHQTEFTQWVEHNPIEILESVRLCMAKALDKATADGYNVDEGLKAIGITNQRETTLVWSKSSGRLEKELSGGRTHFVETCGLPISTYFSALKLLWLMENVEAVKTAIKNGDALFGTIETWLIWNLTGGCGGEQTEPGLHVTDVSNASRTMLMNIKSLRIPSEILPRIISNSVIGKIGIGWPITGIPISGCLGDQHAAMVGQACKKGEAKSTYGTGSCHFNPWVTDYSRIKLGPNAPTNYALEGSIAIAGAAVQWLRDSLGIIQSASEIEELAGKAENTGGVYFVPAFNGLFAPWWRDDARGFVSGSLDLLTNLTLHVLFLRACVFRLKIENEDGDFVLRVDGGATINNLLMQIQADLLGSPVVRPANIETTALGAAYAAGLAVGVWTEQDVFSDEAKQEKPTTFQPKLDEELRKKRVESWCKAVSRTFDLADLSL